MSISRRQTLQLAASGLLLGVLPRLAPARDAGSLSLFAGQVNMYGHLDGVGEAATFFDPRGLARDPRNGDIIVADAANALIRRVNAQGAVTTIAGMPEQRRTVDGDALKACFVGPDAVAVGADGTIFIADSYANTLRVLRGGQVSTLAGVTDDPGYADGLGAAAKFNHPVGIAVDPASGDLLVADSYNHTIRRVDAKGKVRTVAGTPGMDGHRDGAASKALFSTPVGIAVDKDGSILVCEFFNHDVRRIGTDGQVTTLIGGPGEAGDADGPAAKARLRKPQQICLDTDGSLLIADGGNAKLRRLDRQGVVTTVAGRSGQEDVELGPLPGGLRTPYGIAPGPQGSIVLSSGQALLLVRP